MPNDLVICDENENNFHEYLDPNLKPTVRKEVFNHFQELRNNALKEGFDIIIDSGYRSYEYQQNIWNDYLKLNIEALKNQNLEMDNDTLIQKATKLTDLYVARPGQSEHQTGLAFDFAVMRNGIYSSDPIDEEIKWMQENAYKYGFILRYPEGKEDITGYNHEYWHYRYIGLPYSIECFNNNLTLEEYVLKLKK